jgi:sigma-E factor negative regulatory protein RseB
MTRRRRVVLTGLVVAAGVSVAAAGAFGSPTRDATADQAQRLVEQTRTAASAHDFSGSVAVSWVDARGSRQQAVVDVVATAGDIEIVAGGRSVYEQNGDTYVTGDGGWRSVLTTPDASGSQPAPGQSWALRASTGPLVAGRPTTLVEAVRRSGSVAARLYLDQATGLLLRREVLDEHAQVLRSMTFVSFVLGRPPGTPSVAPSGVAPAHSSSMREVPSGYRAPARAGTGYVLLDRARQPDGTVTLTYSDGLFQMSIFERRGVLDWGAMPAGGTTSEVAGTTVRRFREPGVDVVIWSRDGLVFTGVSDAPPDALDAVVRSFQGGRGVLRSITDFVLGPFGWR